MGSRQSKVTLLLKGRSVLEWALEPFSALSIPLVVMVRASDMDQFSWLQERFPGVVLAAGGTTRGESVRNGLRAIQERFNPNPGEIVLVHDAARCLVDSALIERVIAASVRTGAAIPGLAVNDTLKRAAAETRVIDETVSREGLFAVQTPQGFRWELIERAYQSGDISATDDASLVERFAPVTLVEGSSTNIKITRQGDLALAELFLSLQSASTLG